MWYVCIEHREETMMIDFAKRRVCDGRWSERANEEDRHYVEMIPKEREREIKAMAKATYSPLSATSFNIERTCFYLSR